LPGIIYDKTISTIDTDDTILNTELFNCIASPNAFPNDCKEIFFYPVKANPNASVAISIGFKLPHGEKHCDHIRLIICKEIPRVITLILLLRTFFQSEVDRENTEKTLRVYRHEISHLTLGLRNHNDKLKPPYYSIRTYNEIEAVYNDNLSSLEQLGYFTQNTGMLIGAFTSKELEISEVKVFKELLFKWEKMYHRDAVLKHIEFCFPFISESDSDRPLIKTDKRRLEQLIYNLVNNAMKYSYWGTKIYIDCKVIDPVNKKQCLSVIDFGHSIEEGDASYRLYYRNKDLMYKKVEGSGIGLYVAREVARLIGVEVRHKPAEKIADYNIRS
jgi:signal transduction histidine kinase